MTLVVFAFLRSPRAALIPSVAVPVSLIGTFGVMYLFGYSLDNLSLMALTIATGFVVDDAIVVLENIMRHIEAGMPPREAALQGAREIGFTVLSMSVSLVAVFIPILLMGGIVGRLFREFAVVLSAAVVISLVVSLTTTPMMCGALLRPRRRGARAGVAALRERVLDGMAQRLPPRPRLGAAASAAHAGSSRSLTVALNVQLFIDRAEGLLPAAGHRPARRRHPGGAGHLVPGDVARSCRRWSSTIARRPGRRERARLHRRRRRRRRRHQHRPHVRRAEASPDERELDRRTR